MVWAVMWIEPVMRPSGLRSFLTLRRHGDMTIYHVLVGILLFLIWILFVPHSKSACSLHWLTIENVCAVWVSCLSFSSSLPSTPSESPTKLLEKPPALRQKFHDSVRKSKPGMKWDSNISEPSNLVPCYFYNWHCRKVVSVRQSTK